MTTPPEILTDKTIESISASAMVPYEPLSMTSPALQTRKLAGEQLEVGPSVFLPGKIDYSNLALEIAKGIRSGA
jgi:hypothetical protein